MSKPTNEEFRDAVVLVMSFLDNHNLPYDDGCARQLSLLHARLGNRLSEWELQGGQKRAD